MMVKLPFPLPSSRLTSDSLGGQHTINQVCTRCGIEGHSTTCPNRVKVIIPPAPSQRCTSCGVEAGHLTSCPSFRKGQAFTGGGQVIVDDDDDDDFGGLFGADDDDDDNDNADPFTDIPDDPTPKTTQPTPTSTTTTTTNPVPQQPAHTVSVTYPSVNNGLVRYLGKSKHFCCYQITH